MGMPQKQQALYEKLLEQRHHFTRPVVIAGVLLTVLTALGCGAAGVATQMRFYEITAGSKTERITMFPGTAEQATEEAGMGSGFIVTDTREDGATTYITLSEQKQASVHIGNSLYVLPFTSGTVGELLESSNIEIGEDDIITPLPATILMTDTEIKIIQVAHKTEQKTEKIAFIEKKRDNPIMQVGQTRVVQAGKHGEKLVTYDVELHDGKESGRTAKSERKITPPTDQIVEVGTKTAAQVAQESRKAAEAAAEKARKANEQQAAQAGAVGLPQQTYGELSTEGRENVWSEPCSVSADAKTVTINGESYEYSSVVDVKATAYHRIEEGGLITASGTTTQYGSIAVDPRVIPLGSRLYVVAEDGSSWSYGPGIGEDTGGLIKGNRVDLFFMTGPEADTFGVRAAKVYVLK